MTFSIQTVLPYLFYLFAATAVVQLFYIWFIFSRFAFYRKKKGKSSLPPVSVVICAKNEYPNLKENLPLILNQDYPEFEVVVVNDASDDETIFLLEDLSRDYKHIKVVNLTQDLNFFKGKKFPLAIGIKSAKYEHLLLTDADCEPASRQWISEMAGNFSDDREIILGYGRYKSNGGLLNLLIRYETVLTALQYFSYALLGMPYMGVGRNLAYKKSLFIRHKGFISHYNIASGDDDLFINKAATKSNTGIEISPQSFTVSAPKNTFSSWWIQKRRHLSAGRHYKRKHKAALAIYSASYLLMLVLFAALLIFKFRVLFTIGLMAVRLFSMLVIFKKTTDKLNEKKLLLISPLIEAFLWGSFPLMALTNLVFKRNKWK